MQNSTVRVPTPPTPADAFHYYLVQEAGNKAQSYMLAVSHSELTPARILELYENESGESSGKIVREVPFRELCNFYKREALTIRCGAMHANEIAVSASRAGHAEGVLRLVAI